MYGGMKSSLIDFSQHSAESLYFPCNIIYVCPKNRCVSSGSIPTKSLVYVPEYRYPRRISIIPEIIHLCPIAAAPPRCRRRSHRECTGEYCLPIEKVFESRKCFGDNEQHIERERERGGEREEIAREAGLFFELRTAEEGVSEIDDSLTRSVSAQ